MFDNIFAAIEKWMRELLSGMVESNLSTMFTAVNQQTSEIAAQVGQTPQGWNNSIFSMMPMCWWQRKRILNPAIENSSAPVLQQVITMPL